MGDILAAQIPFLSAVGHLSHYQRSLQLVSSFTTQLEDNDLHSKEASTELGNNSAEWCDRNAKRGKHIILLLQFIFMNINEA